MYLFLLLFLSPSITSATAKPINSLSFGVGSEIFEKKKPLATADYFFELSFSFWLTPLIETVSSIDAGIPDAGKNNNLNKRLFLGRFDQSLRLGVPIFRDSLKIALDGGGGLWATRHFQPRLPDSGFRYGPFIAVGPVISYFPLAMEKYRWNDVFLQVKGQYLHYFDSAIIANAAILMVGLGGSF